MLSYYHEAELWLVKTCKLLIDNEWPSDRPLIYDATSIHINSRDEANACLLSALSGNKTVNTLTLKNIVMTSKSQNIMDDFFSLMSIKCVNLINITSEDQTSTLPASLFENKFIQKLSFENMKIGPKISEQLGSMIMNSSSLQKLSIRNVQLENEMIVIADALCDVVTGTLFEFELSGMKINEKQISHLVRSLEKNQRLLSLKLEKCGIESCSARHLAHLLATHKSLRNLTLCYNDLDGDSIGVLAREGLMFNKSLQSLDLSFNPIGDEGAIHLTEVLSSPIQNTTLNSLNLVGCDIWSYGCRQLAQGLGTMRGLRKLSVDGEEEWEDIGDDLLLSMQKNMSLEHFSTSSSLCHLIQTDDKWKDLRWYLRLNQQAKRRILLENGVPLALWPRVLSYSTEEPDHLYYMLRRKPDLLST